MRCAADGAPSWSRHWRTARAAKSPLTDRHAWMPSGRVADSSAQRISSPAPHFAADAREVSDHIVLLVERHRRAAGGERRLLRAVGRRQQEHALVGVIEAAAFHVHLASGQRGQRVAVGEPLPDRHEIGRHTKKARRAMKRQPESGDDLVVDQQRAMPIALAAQTFQESRRRPALAARFENHGGGIRAMFREQPIDALHVVVHERFRKEADRVGHPGAHRRVADEPVVNREKRRGAVEQHQRTAGDGAREAIRFSRTSPCPCRRAPRRVPRPRRLRAASAARSSARSAPPRRRRHRSHLRRGRSTRC